VSELQLDSLTWLTFSTDPEQVAKDYLVCEGQEIFEGSMFKMASDFESLFNGSLWDEYVTSQSYRSFC
jgi:hypothetical protein